MTTPRTKALFYSKVDKYPNTGARRLLQFSDCPLGGTVLLVAVFMTITIFPLLNLFLLSSLQRRTRTWKVSGWQNNTVSQTFFFVNSVPCVTFIFHLSLLYPSIEHSVEHSVEHRSQGLPNISFTKVLCTIFKKQYTLKKKNNKKKTSHFLTSFPQHSKENSQELYPQ